MDQNYNSGLHTIGIGNTEDAEWSSEGGVDSSWRSLETSRNKRKGPLCRALKDK